ncbi:MAG: hypothetical protein PUH00_05285 [Clostridiales bacterium]|nr:hypothetical protein [Clostridiales bacterium]
MQFTILLAEIQATLLPNCSGLSDSGAAPFWIVQETILPLALLALDFRVFSQFFGFCLQEMTAKIPPHPKTSLEASLFLCKIFLDFFYELKIIKNNKNLILSPTE